MLSNAHFYGCVWIAGGNNYPLYSAFKHADFVVSVPLVSALEQEPLLWITDCVPPTTIVINLSFV